MKSLASLAGNGKGSLDTETLDTRSDYLLAASLHKDSSVTMYKPSSLLAFALSGLLLVTLTACDYTGPKGGTLDVRLSSTSSDLDLKSAVITVERVSIAWNYNESNPERFDNWPNMLQEDIKVDLADIEGDGDTRLVRDQVLPGDIDGVNVKLSETAEIVYRDQNGKSVQTTAVLSKKTHGKVALGFAQILLDSENEEATVSLQFDLKGSFDRKKEKDTFQFQPSITVDELVVNGDTRTSSSGMETASEGSPRFVTRTLGPAQSGPSLLSSASVFSEK